MKAHKNLILIIASTGVFFEALDIAIVNLAMPLIQQDFKLANDEIQWMQTLYILLYGCFLIIGGRLADTIGRRKTFVIGNVIFLATSLGAALSFRYDMLVVFRAIQGIGAALMMPSALSIITNTFENGHERAKAIGIFGAFAAVGSGSGMSVGGMIATWFGWQSVFLINVPVIAITLLLTFLFIKQESSTTSTGLFKSLVPKSILKIPELLLAAGEMMLLGAFFTGFLFLISMLLQNNMQYSAATAGLMLFPFSLLSALASRLAPSILMRRMMVHQAAVIGMMLMVIGALLIIASMSLGYNLVLLLTSFACVSGAGMAVCFTTITVLSVQKVPAAQHGVASGVVTTMYFLGGGIGLSILSAVMDTSAGDNNITQLPVSVLMMFAVAGVAGLLYFGSRNLSDAQTSTGPADN